MLKIISQLFESNSKRMLSRHDNSVNTNRQACSTLEIVLNRDLNDQLRIDECLEISSKSAKLQDNQYTPETWNRV